jgi:transcriptional regulator with XRE-family HTH domain
MIIADKIIMLRKKNDWSQEQLAEQLGISRQSVSKWESGAAVPDLDRILKLSELFGVSVDYLVKDEMEEVHYSGTETVDAADGRIVSAEESVEKSNMSE